MLVYLLVMLLYIARPFTNCYIECSIR